MLEYDELKLELTGMHDAISELKDALDIAGAMEKVQELEKLTLADGFWDDMENSQKILQQSKSYKSKIESYDKLNESYEDTLVLMAIDYLGIKLDYVVGIIDTRLKFIVESVFVKLNSFNSLIS